MNKQIKSFEDLKEWKLVHSSILQKKLIDILVKKLMQHLTIFLVQLFGLEKAPCFY